MMPKAYSYIRMSTAEQMRGDSTRRQLRASEDYILREGLEPAEIFHDQGVSAFKGQNAEFGRLGDFLALVEEGQIETGSYLIVESLDRITRINVFEAMGLLHKLIRRGIIVVTLMDGQKYSSATLEASPVAMMIPAVTLMRAHDESRMKSRRLSAAWSAKREEARQGKHTKQRIPAWLQFSSADGTIEVIPENVELLGAIFELSRDGWGSWSIAKKLNGEGRATWGRAKYWQESYVKKLIHNRSVLGELQPHRLENGKRIQDGKPIAGYYPQVIDDDLFLEVQQAVARRRVSGRGRKGKILSNLFSGLIRCPFCGSNLRFIDKGSSPKGGTYLKCARAVSGANCDYQALRYLDVEANLLGILRDVNFDAVLNGEEWRKMTKDLRVSIQILDQRIAELETRKTNLGEAIGRHGFSDTLSVGLSKAEKECEVAVAEREAITEELHSVTGVSRLDHTDLIDRIQADGNEADRHHIRRKLSDEIRKLVKSIVMHPPSSNLTPVDDGFGSGVKTKIIYKNGSFQEHDAATGENLIVLENEKMAVRREKHRLDNLP